METTTQNIKKCSKTVYLIVFIIVLLGILFFIMNKKAPMHNTPQVAPDIQMQEIQTQGTTDELDSIEADLNNTNIDSLDQ